MAIDAHKVAIASTHKMAIDAPMTQESSVHFKLNIPIALKNRLSEAAERSGRSLTAEINTRLQASISMTEDGTMDFTPEGLEAFVVDIVINATSELEERVRQLEMELMAVRRHASL